MVPQLSPESQHSILAVTLNSARVLGADAGDRVVEFDLGDGSLLYLLLEFENWHSIQSDMLFTYDPLLVTISVLVATVGAYTCFDLMVRYRNPQNRGNKSLLVGSAVAMGGSIWAMHFIAMLAVQLPIEIRYDVLTTFVSAIVSVLATGLALVIAATSTTTLSRLSFAGIVMGCGVSGMHYVGMSAIRGNCVLSYEFYWVALSVVIGIVTSTIALWAAMTLHGIRRKAVAATVMGISVSGMHYSGMLGTSFAPIDTAFQVVQPLLSAFSLGMATALATFVILGCTLWVVVPKSLPKMSDDTRTNGDGIDPLTDTADPQAVPAPPDKLPVQRNKRTFFIDLHDIVCITSDGHYTAVYTVSSNDSWFCNYSLTKVEEKLDTAAFLRVHRRHIVNLEHVESFRRKGGNGVLSMCKGQHTIPVSRKNLPIIQEALGI